LVRRALQAWIGADEILGPISVDQAALCVDTGADRLPRMGRVHEAEELNP
jgi:hypothetical protein